MTRRTWPGCSRVAAKTVCLEFREDAGGHHLRVRGPGRARATHEFDAADAALSAAREYHAVLLRGGFVLHRDIDSRAIGPFAARGIRPSPASVIDVIETRSVAIAVMCRSAQSVIRFMATASKAAGQARWTGAMVRHSGLSDWDSTFYRKADAVEVRLSTDFTLLAG